MLEGILVNIIDASLLRKAMQFYTGVDTSPLTTLAEVWQRAAIGPIPGELVVAAGVLFHSSWAVFALVTYQIEATSRRERPSLIAMG